MLAKHSIECTTIFFDIIQGFILANVSLPSWDLFNHLHEMTEKKK